MTAITFRQRPLVDGDLSFAYFLAIEVDPSWRRVCTGGLPLPTRFGERLWRNVHAQLLFETDQGQPLGVGSIFDVNERDRTCSVDVAVLPDHMTGDSVASELEPWAYSRLFERAFTLCGARKAYVTYVAWNPPSFEARWPAAREALLIDHVLHDGSYWDVGCMAIDRPGEHR